MRGKLKQPSKISTRFLSTTKLHHAPPHKISTSATHDFFFFFIFFFNPRIAQHTSEQPKYNQIKTPGQTTPCPDSQNQTKPISLSHLCTSLPLLKLHQPLTLLSSSLPNPSLPSTSCLEIPHQKLHLPWLLPPIRRFFRPNESFWPIPRSQCLPFCVEIVCNARGLEIGRICSWVCC